MLIEVNRVLRPCVYFSHSKSSILKVSFCWEEITSVKIFRKFMDFMTNAEGDTTFHFGANSSIYLMSCQFQLWFRIRFYACMEAFLLNYFGSNKLNSWLDRLKYLKKDLCVTYYGQIQQLVHRHLLLESKQKAGEEMIEVHRMSSVKT